MTMHDPDSEMHNAYVDFAFGPEGFLTKHGLVHRESQAKTAQAIENWFRDGEVGVIEAPTGTGKTLAYLVVAAYRAINFGKRTVIATKTINLQEQIMQTDLPMLERVLGDPFSYSLLKGTSNFACSAGPTTERKSNSLSPPMAAAVRETKLWLNTTTTGDKSESPHGGDRNVWERFSRTSGECTYGDCEHYGPSASDTGCFARAHKVNAKKASIIVTNFSMLYAHMKFSTEKRRILPEFDYLVLDEAHDFASGAREFFRSSFSHKTVLNGLIRVPGTSKWLPDSFLSTELEDQSRELFGRLRGYYRGADYNEDEGLELKKARRSGIDPSALIHAMERVAEQEQARSRGYEFQNMLARANTAFVEDGSTARWVEIKGRATNVLTEPLSVDEEIRSLFSQAVGVVGLSATMTVGGALRHAKQELGYASAKGLIVSSPFDYSERVCAVAADPGVVGNPNNHEEYTQSTLRIYREILKNWPHRVLILCTSNKDVKAVAYSLNKCAAGRRVFEQGAGKSRSEIADAFRADTTSVLVGTRSFEQGLDVKGPKIVVIHRLPFSSQGPVEYALKKHIGGGAAWNRYLAKMLQRLAQGAGRLMRSETDCGIIVLMDPRATSKSYSQDIADSLPRYKMEEYSGDMKKATDYIKGLIENTNHAKDA